MKTSSSLPLPFLICQSPPLKSFYSYLAKGRALHLESFYRIHAETKQLESLWVQPREDTVKKSCSTCSSLTSWRQNQSASFLPSPLPSFRPSLLPFPSSALPSSFPYLWMRRPLTLQVINDIMPLPLLHEHLLDKMIQSALIIWGNRTLPRDLALLIWKEMS